MKLTCLISGMLLIMLITHSICVATAKVSWRYEVQTNGLVLFLGNMSGDYYALWSNGPSNIREFGFFRERIGPKVEAARFFFGGARPEYKPKSIYFRHVVKVPSWVLMLVAILPIGACAVFIKGKSILAGKRLSRSQELQQGEKN